MPSNAYCLHTTNVELAPIRLPYSSLLPQYSFTSRREWESQLAYFYMTADFFISIPLFSFYSILASYLVRDKHYYRRFLFSQNQKQSTRSQRGARVHKTRGLPTPELFPFAVQSFRSEYLHRGKAGVLPLKRAFTPTLLHNFFLAYSSLYYQRSIQMFHPYIRVTNLNVGLPVSTVRRAAFK